ncbi:MAG: pyridoxal phosphate-dependent aminotransferase [Candidatus Thermoplasmatota archaeon]|nr:pyridoxal phosphate-dependent aminotransferase [Candidatus Thermoplasmatota archaeon]MCL5785298.1 pyridoxal phosphate-dependent aminotransferase [Candidatus Thermoplasmatota archaeon]
MVSSRVSLISPSASVSINNLAAQLKARGEKVFNLGIGEPDFTTPAPIIEYSAKSALSGATHYTPSKGIMELRTRISEKLKRENHVNAPVENIIVTPTKFSIYLSMLSILEPGDEVIIPEPYYLSYPDIVRLAGGKPVPLRCNDEYEIDFDYAEKALTDHTRIFILNSPTNPTGKVYSRETIDRICSFVKDHGLYLLSDEIYEKIIYQGEHVSPASLPGMAERTITINGFSKSFAMTGWRIGYMTGPGDIISAADKIQQQTITCASSVSQAAAVETFNQEPESEKMVRRFAERRKIVLDNLGGKGLKFRVPEGAFYFFVSPKGVRDAGKFCSDLMQRDHVVLLPGVSFGENYANYFRLSYAIDDEDLKEGLSRIIRFAREYREK